MCFSLNKYEFVFVTMFEMGGKTKNFSVHSFSKGRTLIKHAPKNVSHMNDPHSLSDTLCKGNMDVTCTQSLTMCERSHGHDFLKSTQSIGFLVKVEQLLLLRISQNQVYMPL